MCITDHHDMTLAVKVALNLNTTNQASVLKFDNHLKFKKPKILIDQYPILPVITSIFCVIITCTMKSYK